MPARLSHPFARLAARTRRRALFALAALVLALVLGLSWIDARLRSAASPHGIVSFELAGDPGSARRMLAAWGDEGRSLAATSLRLDFLLLAAYAPGLSLLCAAAADRARARGSRLALPGVVLAWAALGAGALDALENLLLLKLLGGSTSALAPRIAAVCATSKFAILGMGLFYLVLSLLVRRHVDDSVNL